MHPTEISPETISKYAQGIDLEQMYNDYLTYHKLVAFTHKYNNANRKIGTQPIKHQSAPLHDNGVIFSNICNASLAHHNIHRTDVPKLYNNYKQYNRMAQYERMANPKRSKCMETVETTMETPKPNNIEISQELKAELKDMLKQELKAELMQEIKDELKQALKQEITRDFKGALNAIKQWMDSSD